MIEALVGGMLAGYGIAIPVGAIALLIAGIGMRCGFVCGFSAGAGAATADLAYALVAALAGAAVAARLAPWSTAIRGVSSLALAAMAAWGLWGIRRSPSGSEPALRPRGTDLIGTYGRFLGLTVINPLTVVYFTALVLGSGLGREAGFGPTFAFAVGAFAASLSWQTLLAAVGAFGRRGLSARARSVGLVVGNLVILSLALRLALDR